MDDCIFCKIIKGDIPCTKVWEDSETFAFLSTNPNNHGHTLVVPKKHFRNIFDMDEHSVTSLALATQKIARGVYKGVKAEGVNIIMNNEAPAGQAVFHAHIHIIPRFTNDGLHSWNKSTPYQEDEKEQIAEQIFNNVA